MNLKEKLTFISIGFIFITILFVSLSHSKDEAKQEQPLYKIITDENGK